MKAPFNNFFLFALLIVFISCDKDSTNVPEPTSEVLDTQGRFGWSGTDDMSTIPVTTNFGFGNNSYPSSYDLTKFLPPVGNQMQYGTCVAWAIGYNMKTAINAIDRNYSTSQLTSSQYQFSPKDLFTVIPDNRKGSNCNGTNFTDAFDVVLNRGVATMSTVPYSSLGSCRSSSANSSWATEASNYKIEYWRKIEGSVNAIKNNISNNIPVVFGARLPSNFETWNSSEVMTSGSPLLVDGKHAYHAMVIVGYDDSKGVGGAFRIVNSWGANWGDNGFIWIDYNYFISDFCTSFDGTKPLFIAKNLGSDVSPPDDPDIPTDGVDLAPWVYSDFSTYFNTGEAGSRQINFNIYNIGTSSASSSSKWALYYLYYNAYNANDYGVIFYDEFTPDIPQGTYNCPNIKTCQFNFDIPGGSDFSTTVFSTYSVNRDYTMPSISGSYYLLLFADAYDVLNEEIEINNYFYTTNYPKYFQFGYSSKKPPSAGLSEEFSFENNQNASTQLLRKNSFNKVNVGEFKNAYTTDEIKALLIQKYKSGELKAKIDEYKHGTLEDPYKN